MTKTCIVCKREFPLNSYYFNKCSESSNGFISTCKECVGSHFRFPRGKHDDNNEDGYKICSKCLKKLPATPFYFHKNKLLYLGLANRCKVCFGRSYGIHKNNPKIKKTINPLSRLNRDRKDGMWRCPVCKEEKFVNESNFHRNRTTKNGFMQICKECALDLKKKNKDKNKASFYRRLNNNINIRISRRLRTRIWDALNRGVKAQRTIELLGCSIEYFKEYLESLFTEGMSWDSFKKGLIHIDHIRPCSSFNLTDPEEQKKCFHYTNLQPLWWVDNLKKGSRYDGKESN